MGWFLSGLIIVLVGGVILIGIRKLRAVRQVHRLRKVSQQIVTEALMSVLPGLPQLGDFREINAKTTAVWGTGVMLFEFAFEWHGEVAGLPMLRRQLMGALAAYAEQQHLEGIHGMPVFVVSDMWSLEEKLHIDVAYVVNHQTKEYLDDVNRVEHQ